MRTCAPFKRYRMSQSGPVYGWQGQRYSVAHGEHQKTTGKQVCPCHPIRLIALVALLASAAQAEARIDPAADFFGPNKFHTVHIRMTEEAWRLMQPTRRPRPMAIL